MDDTRVCDLCAIKHQCLQVLCTLEMHQSTVCDPTSAQDEVLQVRQVRNMFKKRTRKLWVVRQINSLEALQIFQVDQLIIGDWSLAKVQMSQPF